MYCVKCGKELKDGQRFCTYCGKPVIAHGISELTDLCVDKGAEAEKKQENILASVNAKENLNNEKRKAFLPKVIILLVACVLVFSLGFVVITNTPTYKIKKSTSIGEKYLERKEFEKAVEEFERALSYEPENEQALELLVDTHTKWGDYLRDQLDMDSAREQYEAAIKYNPVNKDSYIGLARLEIMTDSNRNATNAVEVLRSGIVAGVAMDDLAEDFRYIQSNMEVSELVGTNTDRGGAKYNVYASYAPGKKGLTEIVASGRMYDFGSDIRMWIAEKAEYVESPDKKAEFKYDDRGNLISEKEDNGYWSKYEYDDAGNEVYWENSEGFYKINEYDSNGNLVFINERYVDYYYDYTYDYFETREYDEKNRLIGYEYEYRDDGGNIHLSSDYDEKGMLYHNVDTQHNGKYRLYYDDEGRISCLSNSDATMWFEGKYDSTGNLTLIRDNYGEETRMEYDINGHMIYKIDDLGGEESWNRWERYEYDDNGNRAKYEDSDGNRCLYEYDDEGNCVYASGVLYEDPFWKKAQYDETGNITDFEFKYRDEEISFTLYYRWPAEKTVTQKNTSIGESNSDFIHEADSAISKISESKEVPSGVDNIVGNKASNLCPQAAGIRSSWDNFANFLLYSNRVGRVTYQGDDTFFYMNGYIYRINLEGKVTTVCKEYDAYSLNVIGGNLYYLKDKKIYKIKTDGTGEKELLIEDVVAPFFVKGDIIYYVGMGNNSDSYCVAEYSVSEKKRKNLFYEDKYNIPIIFRVDPESGDVYYYASNNNNFHIDMFFYKNNELVEILEDVYWAGDASFWVMPTDDEVLINSHLPGNSYTEINEWWSTDLTFSEIHSINPRYHEALNCYGDQIITLQFDNSDFTTLISTDDGICETGIRIEDIKPSEVYVTDKYIYYTTKDILTDYSYTPNIYRMLPDGSEWMPIEVNNEINSDFRSEDNAIAFGSVNALDSSSYFVFDEYFGGISVEGLRYGYPSEITIPYSIDGKQVLHIADNAFSDITDLTSVIISDGVQTIGDSAFERCTGLRSVYIPDSVTEMGGSVFRDCTDLETVRLSAGVSFIPTAAFYGCIGLKDIIIPEGVDEIGLSVFDNCVNLKKITLPQSLGSIDSGAFVDCVSMEELVIPDGVLSIGECAFYGCSGLNKVHIGSNTSTIWGRAFYGCSRLKYIEMPTDIEYISADAFEGCESAEISYY